mgnify:CR=1 FL=1
MDTTFKEIQKATVCKECGTIKHSRRGKYTCNGCGRPIKKGDGGTEKLDFNLAWKAKEDDFDGPRDQSDDVHFHNLKCLIAWLKGMSDEQLEIIDYTCLWCHDIEDLKAFRDAIVR